MKIKLTIALLMISFLGISQSLENTTWHVSQDVNPYPQGNYWNFTFTSDSTFVLNKAKGKTYRVNLEKNLIEIPYINELHPMKMKWDENKFIVDCPEVNLIGIKKDKVYQQGLKLSTERLMNICLPQIPKSGTFTTITEIHNKPLSDVNIYVSPYKKIINTMNFQVKETFVQVHLIPFYLDMCQINEYCVTNGMERKNIENLILDNFPTYNQNSDTHVILYIDKHTNIKDVETILWRLSEIKTVKRVFFSMDASTDKKFKVKYKAFYNDIKINTNNIKTFNDWVKGGFKIIPKNNISE